ncbi:MAG: hypothetical protein O3A00_18625, partial [Planctomycetota bacterium]|nr:hypothetical protein [Planctomycetota bacterium]
VSNDSHRPTVPFGLRRQEVDRPRRLEPHRREQQARRVVELLRQADASRGRCRPVLSLGRDGVTVGLGRAFEVATCATITVYNRRGRRLGTVYLGYAPELGQEKMTVELKALIQSILRLGDGSGVQDGVHATGEAVRHALDEEGLTDHSDVSNACRKRRLVGHFRRDAQVVCR